MHSLTGKFGNEMHEVYTAYVRACVFACIARTCTNSLCLVLATLISLHSLHRSIESFCIRSESSPKHWSISPVELVVHLQLTLSKTNAYSYVLYVSCINAQKLNVLLGRQNCYSAAHWYTQIINKELHSTPDRRMLVPSKAAYS